jgi:RNA polymerase sigma factor (sigma-70 family)
MSRATEDYLLTLGRRRELTDAEERALVERARRGERDAREAVVERFLPRIAAMARAYRAGGVVGREELLQEGVLGLLRALERYDPARGAPFWAYAAWWVRQAMQQLVAELTRPLVLSDRALRHLARLKEAHAAALRETGREPGRDALAARAELSSAQVDDLLAVDRPARSLDAPVHGDDAVGAFGDLIADPVAEDEYERVLETLQAAQLVSLLATLSERERDIVRARHGTEGTAESLRDIGARLGLSAERVRQLEQRALRKLAAAAQG